MRHRGRGHECARADRHRAGPDRLRRVRARAARAEAGRRRWRCPRCGNTLACAQAAQRAAGRWPGWWCRWCLYVPANLLPVMTTTSVLGRDSHTIGGGIVELWSTGSHELALIVFIASIVVPVLKIGSLALLAFTAQRRSRWRQRERAGLYRLVDTVGHWSMLDVFVVVLLVGMVQLRRAWRPSSPEPGLLAFGAVVVATMLAASSFDPRLIWPRSQPRSCAGMAEPDAAAARRPAARCPSRCRRGRTGCTCRWCGSCRSSRSSSARCWWCAPAAGRPGDHHRVPQRRGHRGRAHRGALQGGGGRPRDAACRIAPDREKVLVTASLDRSVNWLAVDDTRFWVVRPRIGSGGVSGLGTLVSGAYIGVDAGAVERGAHRASPGSTSRRWCCAASPGAASCCRPTDLGSLDVGSPVYYRRVRVGRVVGYGLSADGRDARRAGVHRSAVRKPGDARARASGTPAASTCRSTRAG